MARIDQIQHRVLADSEKIIDFWRRLFGQKIHNTWNESSPKDFHSDEKRLSKVIEQLVTEAKDHLNHNVENTRIGEASLFIREPQNDRLVLVYSTSSALRDPDGADNRIANWRENFDPIQKILFYSLRDRLAKMRSNEESREQRGLTGWIAVSGHYLLINGEQDSMALDLISKIRTETAPACNQYGTPFWGRKMSEAPSIPDRPKRYLGVPIKSIDSPEITIGVIRYACPLEGAALTITDLAFLEEVASVLSALLHLECTKVRALREAEFPHQVERFNRSGNLHQFLSFMSVSLRSKIISVYLDIGKVNSPEKPSCVRLVDAFGIDGDVSSHRDRLHDYTGDKKPSGFTWRIFKDTTQKPIVRTSVVQDDSWGGYNTEIFYRAALSSLGVNKDNQDIRGMVERYRIKIMGMPITNRKNEVIGVIKAEFPSSFDDADHYENSEDQIFFTECSRVVGEYLENIYEVLSGKYFQERDMDYAKFLRAFTEILRTDLVKQTEAMKFWAELEGFLKKNKDKLHIEGLQIFRDVPGTVRKELRLALMEIVRKFPERLLNIIETLIKTILDS